MNYDASINGLSVGPLQDITIAQMDGVFETPPVRTNLVPRLGAHGSFYGRDTYDARTVTLVLNVWPNRTGSGSTLDSLMQQLEQALIAQQVGSLQLILNGGTRLLNCRPLQWALPRTPAMGKERWGKATVQLVAADPFIYDASLSTLQLASFIPPSTGWTFPWTFAWLFAPANSGSPGTVTAVNNGSIETPVQFHIVGPYDVGFSLQNLTTGGRLDIGAVMRAGDWFDIDTGAETVLFQSTSNRRNAVVQGTDFWKLVPGQNTVRLISLGAQGGSPGLMSFRSAYTALRA